jgi:carbon-monoxide dehydrogenase small subunit
MRVNGETSEVAVAPNRTLLEVLREDLRLTGTKRGCDDASCGACTVFVDGKPQLSCIVLALCMQEAAVKTIEGATVHSQLSALQESLVNEGGLQCGYCTPGVVLAAQALLENTPDPSEKEIREGISNNLCRCTGYSRIIAAVKNSVKGKKVPAGADS